MGPRASRAMGGLPSSSRCGWVHGRTFSRPGCIEWCGQNTRGCHCLSGRASVRPWSSRRSLSLRSRTGGRGPRPRKGSRGPLVGPRGRSYALFLALRLRAWEACALPLGPRPRSSSPARAGPECSTTPGPPRSRPCRHPPPPTDYPRSPSRSPRHPYLGPPRRRRSGPGSRRLSQRHLCDTLFMGDLRSESPDPPGRTRRPRPHWRHCRYCPPPLP